MKLIDLTRYDMKLIDMARYGKIWQDMARYDKIWQDMARYGIQREEDIRFLHSRIFCMKLVDKYFKVCYNSTIK